MNLSISETPRDDPAADFPVAKIETSLGLRAFEAPAVLVVLLVVLGREAGAWLPLFLDRF